jgi:hypothetical protein
MYVESLTFNEADELFDRRVRREDTQRMLTRNCRYSEMLSIRREENSYD